jgi:phosphatidylglycerol:prolipoprotein diacylglycerol transferase
MFPIIFNMGPLTIHTYGVALAVAFLVVVKLARHAAERLPRNVAPLRGTALVDWAVWTALGGILGGRLLYVVLNWDVYAVRPWEIIALWHGGLVWYGGLLGGLLATGLYLKSRGHEFLQGVDQVIPFIAFGHAIGRIGCFTNGCCLGVPTAAWFGVSFPGQPQPVVPTQLLESAGLVALYLILRALQTPGMLQRPGRLFGAYLIGYAMIRWTIEFWRADQPIVWAGLTLHQAISLALFVVGLGLLVTGKNRARARTNRDG